jgi:hypothetical protein
MRIFISVGLILTLLFTPTIASKAATPPTTHIFLDQIPIKQATTYRLDQVIYVEAKPLLLADSFKLQWNASNQTLQIDRRGISATVTVNSVKAQVNNKNVTLRSQVIHREGAVYISVDDLATIMGKELAKSINSTNMYYNSSLKDLIYNALNDTDSTYKYEGKLVQNKRSGVGKLYRNGQLLYEGNFSENVLSGYGKLYNNGKLLVEGGFSDNEPDGNASYYMASGEVYEGAFLNGRMTGEGSLYRGKILLYNGNWLDGKMEGIGAVYDSGGNVVYSGSLGNSVPDGFGIQFVGTNKRYQGYWNEGRKHGQGMLFDDDGNLTYMGNFANDQKSGVGANVRFATLTWVDEGPNNTIISEQLETATMNHGQFNNDILFRASSEVRYTGQFDENKVPNGIGKLYSSTGQTSSRLGTLDGIELIYEGSVKDAKRHGVGKVYEDLQLIYDGSFSNDVRRGKGKEYVAGQLVYNGNWINDRRNGVGKLYEYYGDTSKFTGTGTVIIKDVEYLTGRLRSTKLIRKYAGDIVNGSMTGNGSLYELNISSTTSYLFQAGVHVFNGAFKDGLRDGAGIEYNRFHLKQYEGNYANDMRNGKGKEYLNGSLIYDGSFLNDKKDGYGKLYVNNSLVYEGYFKENKKNGYGKAIKNNVVTFEGEFIDDIQQ